jgi:hypothetical protein
MIPVAALINAWKRINPRGAVPGAVANVSRRERHPARARGHEGSWSAVAHLLGRAIAQSEAPPRGCLRISTVTAIDGSHQGLGLDNNLAFGRSIVFPRL